MLPSQYVEEAIHPPVEPKPRWRSADAVLEDVVSHIDLPRGDGRGGGANCPYWAPATPSALLPAALEK